MRPCGNFSYTDDINYEAEGAPGPLLCVSLMFGDRQLHLDTPFESA